MKNSAIYRSAASLEEDTQDLTRAYSTGSAAVAPVSPWPGGIWPTEPSVSAPVGRVPMDPPYRTRMSGFATMGLIASLVGLCATLTGLLAPEGLALGVLGVLAALVGLVRTFRPWIAGLSLALLALLVGAAAAGLAVLAITGHLSWLSSHADAVPQWRDWLVARWPWLGRW